ncbi:ABC-F family ATP-binding cassette domain-containing protein [Campylobacter jejuni]|nr:ABC-F family ATP-binding cassette domain-containing protein [Campylobacter jejuni]
MALIDLIEASKKFGDKIVLNEANFSANEGEKIAIIGKNGEGKSTFLKTLLGALPLDSGRVIRQNGKSIAMLSQTVDFNANLSVKEAIKQELAEIYNALEEYEILHKKLEEDPSNKDYLKKIDTLITLIDSKDAWNIESKIIRVLKEFNLLEYENRIISTLSGGEKNRVALALLFTKEYDVLILDEPTNDLDIATINILEEYLLSFEGAILLVSHDRYFVDKIATKLYAFEGNGYINILHTLYTEYLENEKEIEELDNFALELQTQEQNNNQKEKSFKKLSYKENEILKNHPEKIDFLEQKIAKLNQDLSDPNVYQEIGINKLYQELEVMQKELEILENEYFLVLEKSENL